MRRVASSAAAIAGLFLTAATASAAVTGTVYQTDPTATDASIIPSSSLPHADFSVTAINFNTNCSDCTTTADFLNDPTFTNAQNGFNPLASADNTFLLLSGSAYLLSGANSFVVGHDDGVVITFPGLNGGSPVVSAPGPTSLNLTPFTVDNPGVAGLYTFTLQYAECCGGPADLDFTVNGAPVGGVPEPTTWAMMLVGLGGLGAAMRSRRRLASATV